MRHNVVKPKLGRPKKERVALLKGLVQDAVLHGHIRTTEAKAKAVKPILEKLLMIPQRMDERNAIRALDAVFSQEAASRKVLGELKTRIGTKKTGLVRIRKVGIRKGDAAQLVQLEIL